MSTETLLAAVIMYAAVPAWLLAGFGDYLCHRAARIEHSSGLKESLLHVAQLAEVGLPALVALLFEINALVLLLMLAGLLLHEATAVWDVAYADMRRKVSTVEQHVHGLLERLPWFAFVMLTILHWQSATAGLGGEGFALAAKARPLPTAYVAGVLSAVVLLGVLPFGEEIFRCWRARKKERRPARGRRSGSAL